VVVIAKNGHDLTPGAGFSHSAVGRDVAMPLGIIWRHKKDRTRPLIKMVIHSMIRQLDADLSVSLDLA
jgi:hypothetical protein